MRYKRILIESNENYPARIFNNPKAEYFKIYSTLHWHNECEIIYVKKGPLKLKTLNGTITLNDDDIYFFNSEELHSYLDINNNLKFIIVSFSPELLLPYIKLNQKNPKFVLNKENEIACKNIANSLKVLTMHVDSSDKVEILKIKAILNNIFYYLLKYCYAPEYNYTYGSDSEDFDCAKIAINYMNEHYTNHITLSEIAEYVGMTSSHFSKYFKDKTQMTFSKYLRNIRLEHAINDLLSSKITVKDAALNNGFPNVNAFILACKSEYNKTPIEIRKHRNS
jgi:xylan 1,4-beta-xylosidase